MPEVLAQRLARRHVVVTGALGALGRAVVEALAAQGAAVAAVDRSVADARPEGARLVIGGIDLADAASAAQAMRHAADALGAIDGLVNIAGGFAWERLEAGSPDTFRRQFETNLLSAVTATHAALPHLVAAGPALAGGAAVVNVGALGARRGAAGMGPYAASKAGVERFTEALAEEMKDAHVRVNAVLPSTLDTPANRREMPQADTSRWVAPAQLAAAIVFLLSAEAAAVTGAALPVAGRV
jgi:NAD(P)-dependent dehydrogenase (short-subunit alcohol dehydrogenase family)